MQSPQSNRNEMGGMQSPNQQIADVIQLNPSHAEEGFLEGSVLERNPVMKSETKQEMHSRHGDSLLQLVTLENGRKYEVVLSEPMEQRSDFPVVFTTALGTSVRGHNWHTMHQMMDLGYPVVLIGPEGGHPHVPKTPRSWQRFMKNLMNISLEETASNMHEILEFTSLEKLSVSVSHVAQWWVWGSTPKPRIMIGV
jgi:hypothetical protein